MQQGQEGTHVTSELESEANAGPQLVIWGTDVVVSHCKDKFHRFILKYVEKNVAEDKAFEGMDISQPYYLQRPEEINAIEEPFLNIDCEHLRDFDGDLYRQLINYPQEVIPTFDIAVNEVFFDKYPAAVLEHQIHVRPYHAEKTRNMRSLNPEVNMSEKRRFANHSEEEIMTKRQASVPKNTQKNNKVAAEILKQYLREKKQPV